MPLKSKLLRFWYAQNYAFCKSNAYLASQRGENAVVADWLTRASEWELKLWKLERGLV